MDTRTGEVFRLDEPMDEAKRARMEEAKARDEFVAISEQVAERNGADCDGVAGRSGRVHEADFPA